MLGFGESSYGQPLKPVIDRSQLPTAPRAARGPDVDLSIVPTAPPFKAHLGNLPYDISPEDIEQFFNKLKVSLFNMKSDKQGDRSYVARQPVVIVMS